MLIRHRGGRRSAQTVRDPFTRDDRDPLELLARLLVGSSFKVPAEGRSSRPSMVTSDIAAAVGFMGSDFEKRVALAVATRADRRQVARLVGIALIHVARTIRHQQPRPLDLSKPQDRWRLRMVVFDAANELVNPEPVLPFGRLAKEAKMRKGNYIAVHRAATAVLQDALNRARTEFKQRLRGESYDHVR